MGLDKVQPDVRDPIEMPVRAVNHSHVKDGTFGPRLELHWTGSVKGLCGGRGVEMRGVGQDRGR